MKTRLAVVIVSTMLVVGCGNPPATGGKLPDAEGTTHAPKSLEQLQVRCVVTDLTEHGIPLSIDLPDVWRIQSSAPGYIDFPIEEGLRLQLNLQDRAVPLGAARKSYSSGPGKMLLIRPDAFYYRREMDANDQPYVEIRRDISTGDKVYSMEAYSAGVPRTRDLTDTIWGVMQSLKPVLKH